MGEDEGEDEGREETGEEEEADGEGDEETAGAATGGSDLQPVRMPRVVAASARTVICVFMNAKVRTPRSRLLTH